MDGWIRADADKHDSLTSVQIKLLYFSCVLNLGPIYIFFLKRYRLLCTLRREITLRLFISQVFKLLAGTYANAHQTMSNENARCGPSRTSSQKGTVNGAQWSSITGGGLNNWTWTLSVAINEMWEEATRCRCKTSPDRASGKQWGGWTIRTLSHRFLRQAVLFSSPYQACKTSTTFTPTVLRWPWSWVVINSPPKRNCLPTGKQTTRL